MVDIDVIEEVWDILKIYIPEKDKQVAADHLIPVIADCDFPTADFVKFVKSDHHLEIAASEYIDIEDDDDEDDEEEY
jgi:hypothetical protein